MAIFLGGRWFWSRLECVDFAEKHIPARQFQWLLDTVSYLQFVKGETVLTVELQQGESHVSKVRKRREQSIVILVLKKDVPHILGGLRKGKELTTPLTDIRTPELWDANDGVSGV